jgi:hypothetical protein
MHEPGKNVGPSRDEWDHSQGNGLHGESQFGEADLDRLLAVLKAPEDVCPAPGFYARVMDRIETQRGTSIWSVFLEPIFGRRLAMASGVLMLLLGAALFVPGSEVEDGLMGKGSLMAVTGENQPAPVVSFDSIGMDDRDQDKDAVLVNLVTYQEH